MIIPLFGQQKSLKLILESRNQAVTKPRFKKILNHIDKNSCVYVFFRPDWTKGSYKIWTGPD